MLNTTACIIFFSSLCKDNSSVSLDCYCVSCAKQHSWAERDFPNYRKQKSLACLEEYIVQGQGRGREIICNWEQIYLPEGKIDIRSETFCSNPLFISKIYLKHDLMCCQLVHFPLCLTAPCIKPPLLCCTLCGSPQPYSSACKSCSCLKVITKALLFCTHSLLRKYTSLLSWMGKTKSLSAGTNAFLYLEKITLNSIPFKTSALFQWNGNFSCQFRAGGGRQGAWLEKVKRNKHCVGYKCAHTQRERKKESYFGYLLQQPCMILRHIVLTPSLGEASCWTTFPSLACLADFFIVPFWKPLTSKRTTIMMQNITHFT